MLLGALTPNGGITRAEKDNRGGEEVNGWGSCGAKTLTFSNMSVISEDMYLKLRLAVYYQKGNPY